MKGYRTVIVMFALGLLPVLQMTEAVALIPPAYQSLYTVAVAVVAVALRVVTTTPIGRSDV